MAVIRFETKIPALALPLLIWRKYLPFEQVSSPKTHRWDRAD
jgi:hypothetical protein